MRACCFLFMVLVVAVVNAQTNSAPVKSNPDVNGVYSYVDIQPAYPGGDDAFLQFIVKNLILPEIKDGQDIPGKVVVRFIIDTDGSITHITFLRPVFPELEKELIRVLKLMPKFEPGMQNGKAVKVYFNLPLTDLYMHYK